MSMKHNTRVLVRSQCSHRIFFLLQSSLQHRHKYQVLESCLLHQPTRSTDWLSRSSIHDLKIKNKLKQYFNLFNHNYSISAVLHASTENSTVKIFCRRLNFYEEIAHSSLSKTKKNHYLQTNRKIFKLLII